MTKDELHRLIAERCTYYGVSLALAEAIAMVESNYRPYALGDYTDEGFPESYGAMQCHLRGACSGLTAEQATVPETNIDHAVAYLRSCVRSFPGDIKTAISAYNQGIAGARKRGWEFTRGYVASVLSYLGTYVPGQYCQIQ